MASVSGVTAGATSTTSAFSTLSAEDFTKIILQELSRQDPLQPSDTNSLIQQLSGIRSIQSDMDLSSRLNDLVRQSEFSNASTLIGKKVSGVSIESERVTGVVKAVSRTSQGTILTLRDDTLVPVANVDRIDTPEEAPPTT